MVKLFDCSSVFFQCNMRVCDLPTDVLCVVLALLRPQDRNLLRRCSSALYALPPVAACCLRLSVANFSRFVGQEDHLSKAPRFWGTSVPSVALVVRTFDEDTPAECVAVCAQLAAEGFRPETVCVWALPHTFTNSDLVVAVVNALADAELPWPEPRLELHNVDTNVQVSQFSDRARLRLAWCDAVLCTANDESPRPSPFPLLRNLRLSATLHPMCSAVASVFGPDPEMLPALERLDMGPMHPRYLAGPVRLVCQARHPKLRAIHFRGTTYSEGELLSVDLGGLAPRYLISGVEILRAGMLTPEAMLATSASLNMTGTTVDAVLDLAAAGRLCLPNLRQLTVMAYDSGTEHTLAQRSEALAAVLRTAPVLAELVLHDDRLVDETVVRAVAAVPSLRTIRLVGYFPLDQARVARLLLACPPPVRIFGSVTGLPLVIDKSGAWQLISLADPGPPNPRSRVNIGPAFDPSLDLEPTRGAPAWTRYVRELVITQPLAEGFGQAAAALARPFPCVDRIGQVGEPADMRDLVALCVALGPRLVRLSHMRPFQSGPENEPEVLRACPWLLAEDWD